MQTLDVEYLPEVLRPFEEPLHDASEQTLREHLERLRVALTRLRRNEPDHRWSSYIQALRRHPVWAFVQQDPFVRRAAEKPRGYPGDAVMIDYIYRADSLRPEIESLTAPAAVVHDFVNNGAAPRAVRYRRQFAAQVIDEVAKAKGPGTKVVSIAAGHLREAELSQAARDGIVEFVAIDQDAESLATIRQSAGAIKVETIEGSVRQLLTGQRRIPYADLVYALGLFDYLPQPVAQNLTTLMLTAVRPGGVMLIPNFLPDITDIGWLESFLDWKLIYRRDSEMLDLLDDWTLVSRAEIHRDPDHNITFLKVVRR